jgi:hypothetical protein
METTRARALLDRALITPVLDGFDEIPEHLRGTALGKINDAIRLDEGLVLTSRTEAFAEAVHPDASNAVWLTGAVGIELCALDLAIIPDYLAGPPGSPARQRWNPVFTALANNPHSALAKVLTSPLMVSLLRTIYSPGSGHYQGELPDPQTLLHISDRTALEEQLFDGFIPAAYRPHPDPTRSSRWSAQQAERWLSFLARFMERRWYGKTDIQLSDLARAVPGWVPRLLAACGVGLLMRLAAGWLSGLSAGLAVVMVCGLPVNLSVGEPVSESETMQWNRTFGWAILGGLGAGTLIGFPIGAWKWLGTSAALIPVIAVELAILIVVALVIAGRLPGFMLGVLAWLFGGFAIGLVFLVRFGVRPALWTWLTAEIVVMLIIPFAASGDRLPDTSAAENIQYLILMGVMSLVMTALALLPAAVGVIYGTRLSAELGVGERLGGQAIVAPWGTTLLLTALGALLGVGLVAGPRSQGPTVRAAFFTATLGALVVVSYGPRIALWVWIGVSLLLVGAAVVMTLIDFPSTDGKSIRERLRSDMAILAIFLFMAAMAVAPLGLGVFLGQHFANLIPSSFDAKSIGLALILGAIVGILYERRFVRPSAVLTAWFSFAISRKLPLRLRAFLDDAHMNRSVLRRVGTVYQFRHERFQRRLANR